MKYLADENISPIIVRALRESGHEVLHVLEVAPGIADEEVLGRAEASGSVLLTQDKDFGFLVFYQRRVSGGVVLLRLAGIPVDTKAALLLEVIQEYGADLPEHFTVVTQERIRIRSRE